LSFGSEKAVAAKIASIRVYFGRGPREVQATPEKRAAALLTSLGSEMRALRWCRQVHGTLLASLSDRHEARMADGACVGSCDGLITAEIGLGLLVWTADCVPVILCGGGVVAAVHCGWRGCAAGMVPTAVRRFDLEYGVPPSKLVVLLGPAIGPCHYPVGAEVVEALAAGGVPADHWLHDERVDLRAFIIAQLVASGVDKSRIDPVGGCTACDDSLASYRRDGESAGRQWSLVYRVDPEARREPLS
jgi:YfiH family protein